VQLNFKREEKNLHQTYSYFQDVILQSKVGEAVPELSGASLDIFPGAHQAFLTFVEVESWHVGDFL
jgi:hypothetical protein